MNYLLNDLEGMNTKTRGLADNGNRRKARTSRRGILIAGMVLLGFAFSVPATAGEHRGHRGGGGGGGKWVERHAEELGIDDATLAEINQILDASREQGKSIYKEHRAARDAMRALLDQDEPNLNAVMQQTEVIGKVDVRKHKHRLTTMLQIRAKLTPEQRQQLREIKGERGERRDRGDRGDRKGKRRGHERGERGDDAATPVDDL